jgi:hypothetical protein
MNNQVHPKLRPFINWFAPIDADNVKLGHALRESANDGEPAYIRMPELDKRLSRGDFFNSNAWFDTAKRTARYFCVGFNPLDGKWLPVVERSEVTR